jgi:hypothetical protein
MVVDLALLPRFPTDREDFVEVGFVDEVAGIVRLPEEEIFLQAVGVNWMAL